MQRTDWRPPEAGAERVGKVGEGAQKVQTCSYEVSCGDVMSSMVTIVNNTGSRIWKLT